MDKLERLMDLMVTLLETEHPVTAEEIRRRVPGYPDKLESFRRAFERDKDELRDMNVPLQLEPVPGSDPPAQGYRIHKSDFYLRDPGFEPDEVAALHLAAEAVHLEGVSGHDALWRLGGLDPDATKVVDGTQVSLRGDPNLTPLFTAVMERRTVEFAYHGEPRALDPYLLEFQRGWWYVTGRDHRHDERRQYRVDRIEGDVAIGEPGAFERPATLEQRRGEPWELGEGEPVTARLLVDAEQAPWALQQLADEHVVERRADGTIVAEVPVVNWPGFRSFVLGFLDHAELLGPEQWREELCTWLEAMS